MLIIFRNIILFLVGIIYIVLGIVRSYPSHFITAGFTFAATLFAILHQAHVLKNKAFVSIPLNVLGYVMMVDLLYIYHSSTLPVLPK